MVRLKVYIRLTGFSDSKFHCAQQLLVSEGEAEVGYCLTRVFERV